MSFDLVSPPATPARRTRRRTALAVAAVALAAVVVALVAFDTWLLVARPQARQRLQLLFKAPDAELGWRNRPGASGVHSTEGFGWVAINDDGTRGPAVARAKPQDTLRIALLGDSFTAGFHVHEPQTFRAAVARRLANCPARRGRGVEVVNFGVPGYGTAQELRLLDATVLAYEPDAVVLAFFLNDVQENRNVPLDAPGQQALATMRPQYRLDADGALHYDTDHETAARRFLAQRQQGVTGTTIAALLAVERIRSGIDRLYMTLAEPQTAAVEPAASALRSVAALSAPTAATAVAADPDWRLTAALLGAVHDRVRAAGARFLLVGVPNPYRIQPSVRGMPAPGADEWHMPARLDAVGRQRGFAVLDLQTPMAAYVRRTGTPLYLELGQGSQQTLGHWNPHGHAVAGALMAQRLCAMFDEPG